DQSAYWLIWAASWLLASLVLPALIVYHYSYVFPLVLAVLVLAGVATGEIYTLLRTPSPSAAVPWVTVSCSLNLLSLASHFQDGSRYDQRPTAKYIAKNWHAGDRVAAISGKALGYYEPACKPVLLLPPPPTSPVPDLEKLCSEPGRLWIVVLSDR